MISVAAPYSTRLSSQSRVDWIDIARGAAIILVIAHHSMIAALQIGEIPYFIEEMNSRFLYDLRMPLFFFCSGLLARWGLNKPLNTIARRRIYPLAWIIVLWTFVYLVVDHFVHLYPWGGRGYSLHRIAWAPYGNLWFIYAILFITLTVLFLKRWTLPVQIGGILLLALLLQMFVVGRLPQFPDNSFIATIANYALICFASGYWLAPHIIKFYSSMKRTVIVIIFAAAAWTAIELAVLGMGEPDYQLPRIVTAIPAIVIGVGVARFLSEVRWIAAPLQFSGRRSLELFLLHQIFIAIAFFTVDSLGIISGMSAMASISIMAIAGTILAERLIAMSGTRHLFFSPPSFGKPFRALRHA